MSDFRKKISNHIKSTISENDKRIMHTGLELLTLGDILTPDVIDVLNEFFKALKEDYTLVFSKDKNTLEFEVIIVEQNLPIIENKHYINIMYNELVAEKNLNKIEESVLLFFNACEHIEEQEILIVNNILDKLANNWTLKPIEIIKIDGKDVKSAKFVPIYQKELVKSK